MKALPVVFGLLLLVGATTAPKASQPHELKVTVSGMS